MTSQLKNGIHISLHQLEPAWLDLLVDYLTQLGPETRSRFGPHTFDKPTIEKLFRDDKYLGFVASEIQSETFIAYAIVKQGYLEHDWPRLSSHGLRLDAFTDATLAPSVADTWQSKGVGAALFDFIATALKNKGFRRIILWGGVQSSNIKAVNFYIKKGFRIVGAFDYNGHNWDMVLDL